MKDTCSRKTHAVDGRSTIINHITATRPTSECCRTSDVDMVLQPQPAFHLDGVHLERSSIDKAVELVSKKRISPICFVESTQFLVRREGQMSHYQSSQYMALSQCILGRWAIHTSISGKRRTSVWKSTPGSRRIVEYTLPFNI